MNDVDGILNVLLTALAWWAGGWGGYGEDLEYFVLGIPPTPKKIPKLEIVSFKIIYAKH